MSTANNYTGYEGTYRTSNNLASRNPCFEIGTGTQVSPLYTTTKPRALRNVHLGGRGISNDLYPRSPSDGLTAQIPVNSTQEFQVSFLNVPSALQAPYNISQTCVISSCARRSNAAASGDCLAALTVHVFGRKHTHAHLRSIKFRNETWVNDPNGLPTQQYLINVRPDASQSFVPRSVRQSILSDDRAWRSFAVQL